MPCNYIVHISIDNVFCKGISAVHFFISLPRVFVFLLTYCQHIFFRDVPGARWAEERNQCHVIIVFIVLFITCSFIFLRVFLLKHFCISVDKVFASLLL